LPQTGLVDVKALTSTRPAKVETLPVDVDLRIAQVFLSTIYSVFYAKSESANAIEARQSAKAILKSGYG
jgi:ribosome-binding factor A